MHHDKKIAINEEVFNDEVLAELGIHRDELVQETAVEVGNIFTLGTRFSDPLELHFTDEDGLSKPVIMGSYGIGPSRLMGLIAEHFADDKGIIWPEAVAPYRVYLVRVGDDEAIVREAQSLYEQFSRQGTTVLYDDRDERPGAKFADAELLGMPHRVTVSPRSLEQGGYEYTARTTGESSILTAEELLAKLA